MIQITQKKIGSVVKKYYTAFKLPNLDKSQWWSLEKLEKFQNKRLQVILKYAYNNIPGYRGKFREVGITPKDIRSEEDLYKLPIVTREEMQNNPDFVNKSLITGTLYTGGSTGTSLKYYESLLSSKMRRNVHLRGWDWNGYRPGKRLAIISSAQGRISGKNTLNLSGDLSEENLKLNVDKLIEFKPEHLRGYVSSLYILAKYCLDNNIEIEGIKSINPISENLYDYQKKTMKSAFNCEIFEEYCCNDGGTCAWECEKHEGLHYVMERAIIEDSNGEMVVTDLWNLAMPFIRYKNGDSFLFLDKKCQCGRELPLITVKGRANDIIITPAGPVSPTFLMYHGIKYDDEQRFRSGFRAVQYIQKPGYKLEINIVKNPWCKDEEIRNFRQDLSQFIRGMDIQINFVGTIPMTKKGKRNFIINEDKELLKTYRF